MGDLSTNLSRNEFRCRCGECEPIAVDFELVKVLQNTVDRLPDAKSIFITSGHRCEAHNKAVDGSKNSKHLYGIAADFYLSGATVEEVAKYLDEKYPDKYGLGIYNTWIHLDMRPEKARWRG